MPKGLAARSETRETVASNDACTFGECPDGVVFRAFEESADLENKKPEK